MTAAAVAVLVPHENWAQENCNGCCGRWRESPCSVGWVASFLSGIGFSEVTAQALIPYTKSALKLSFVLDVFEAASQDAGLEKIKAR